MYRFFLTSLSVATILSCPAARAAHAEDPPTFVLEWGTLGTGPGQFSHPEGLGSDGAGNVYVADTGNDRIQKFSSDGQFVAAWGASGSGPGLFAGIFDVIVDAAGLIYASDSNNGRIQVFDSQMNYVRQWSLPIGRSSGHLALNESAGILYTNSGDEIFAFSTDGTYLHEWQYTPVVAGTIFGFSVGPSSDVYTQSDGNSIARFSLDGRLVNMWGSIGEDDGEFNTAEAVAVDNSENIYATDGNGRVQKFTSDGAFLSKWGEQGSGAGQFSSVLLDIAVTPARDIFVLDRSNNRILKFSYLTAIHPATWGQLKARYR